MTKCDKCCNECEIELSSDPIYSKEVYSDGFTRKVKIYDAFNELVVTYTQTIEFTDKLSDDDLAYVQNSLDNAQKAFLQTLKKPTE